MQTIPLTMKGFPNCNIDLEAVSISDFYEVGICAAANLPTAISFALEVTCASNNAQPLLEQSTHLCTHKYVVNLAALGKGGDKRKKTFCDRCRHSIMNSNPSTPYDNKEHSLKTRRNVTKWLRLHESQIQSREEPFLRL
jgi:hypothetical protein